MPPDEKKIVLPANGWLPRADQMGAWAALEGGTKRVALAAHRRWGKDEIALHWAARSAMARVGTYWHMLPQANQSRKAIWDAIDEFRGVRRIDLAFPKEIRATTREQDMLIRFKNGSTWQVVGSDNYNSLVGSPPVGVVFSEYALADPGAWAYLRQILARNNGWAIFISTPRGRNHFARMVEYAKTAPEWYGQVVTVEQSGLMTPEQISRERRELTAERGAKEAEAIIRQELYCDFDAAIPGAYYGELLSRAQDEGRIGDFPWLSNLPVGIACDLGHGDQTVCWFYQQLPSGRIRIIDVLQGSGVGIDWYAHRICKRPYAVIDTIWPHDGAHGNIRDVNNTSLQDQAGNFGWRPIRCLDRDQSVDIGIQAVRQILPMIEFNSSPIPYDGETPEDARGRMSRALDALRQYRREWDEKRQCFKDAPLHDWTSDYADAFRYLARGIKPFRGSRDPNIRRAGIAEYSMFG